MSMEIGGSGAKMGTAYKPEGASNGHAKAGEAGAAAAAGPRDFLEAFHKLPDGRFKHLSNGLAIATLADGHGAAATKGSSVKVRYTGWLEDGTKFDSSEDKGQPFEFKLGSGQVIQGWEEALSGAKVGERRQIVVPASLAYGSRQVGNIPPNSTLIFDIEVVGVGDLPPNPKGTMSIMA